MIPIRRRESGAGAGLKRSLGLQMSRSLLSLEQESQLGQFGLSRTPERDTPSLLESNRIVATDL